MTADLRLVTHAAERDTAALSADRVADADGDGRLAHAGRADQTDDLPLSLIAELSHRELFDNALLDLFETVVVAVKLLLNGGGVDLFLCHFVPRQFQTGIYVGLDHARLVAAEGQSLEL